MQDSISQLLPKFLENLKQKNRSPSTILAYKADLEQLISFLAKKNKALVTEVQTSDLESFRDWLLSQKYTPKSASRKLNAVRTFFRWLQEENLVKIDPSKNVSHPKVEPSLPKSLSPLEYRALRDVARTDVRIAAIIELILQTGMRISEVANLKVENMAEKEIVIEAYATQSQRTTPLNQLAKLALNSYLKERPQSNSPYVFVSRNGKPLAVRNIRAAIDRYMQKADIPGYSVNDLRTTFIVQNLKASVDLVLISQAVGHKRLSTTERYLKLAKTSEPGKKQVLEEL